MNSVNSGMAALEGTVQTHSIPNMPLKDVSVYWMPGGRTVKTDAMGYFTITNIEPVNGKLITEKPGYSSDTMNITWADSKKITKQINLLKAPEIDSISIYSVVIKQKSSAPNSFLVVLLKINDRDNILGSVSIENAELDIKKTLRYNFTESNTFLDTLTISELKVQDVEKIIGLDFDISVKSDNLNREFLLSTERIARVIKDDVKIVSPDSIVVSSRPELRWEPFTAGYSFSYMVEIYTTDLINPELVKRETIMNPEAVSYTVTEDLEQRNYYWVVWVIDKFGNRVRSIPAGFFVQ
ncbi:MAG: hypothetical protein R6W90_11700 [Ignavibacteriaceae bacterium]